MTIIIKSFALTGVNAYNIDVEVNTYFGQPGISIIGMADQSIKEASERIKAAIVSSGYDYPKSRVVFNLAPSSIKKFGTHFDLAMAIGLLVQTDQLTNRVVDHYCFIGELSLNGKLRRINGILPMIIEAKRLDHSFVIVPLENLKEAQLVTGITTFGFTDFKHVITFLEGKYKYNLPLSTENQASSDIEFQLDYSDVVGQRQIIRNAVIAASGGHNMLLIGEPGCGKSMIASRLPTILPSMNAEEALEVTKIYSISGLLTHNIQLMSTRPFRAPHHNASLNSIIGGGNKAMPGEVSLAHNGVLFLDEMVEFNRKTLEALRQPLEDKQVTISRVHSNNTYPANFILVAAINPCPCGYYGNTKCNCTPSQIKRYQQKISGPILDRIDIVQTVKPINVLNLTRNESSKSSAELKVFVQKAREIQEQRFSTVSGINCNAQMNSAMINKYCTIDNETKKIIEIVFQQNQLNARTYTRVLRIARTFADIEGMEYIRKKDVLNALKARGINWGSGT